MSCLMESGIRDERDPFHVDVASLAAAASMCGAMVSLRSADDIGSTFCLIMCLAMVPLRELGSLRRMRFLVDCASARSFFGILSTISPLYVNMIG